VGICLGEESTGFSTIGIGYRDWPGLGPVCRAECAFVEVGEVKNDDGGGRDCGAAWGKGSRKKDDCNGCTACIVSSASAFQNLPLSLSLTAPRAGVLG